MCGGASNSTSHPQTMTYRHCGRGVTTNSHKMVYLHQESGIHLCMEMTKLQELAPDFSRGSAWQSERTSLRRHDIDKTGGPEQGLRSPNLQWCPGSTLIFNQSSPDTVDSCCCCADLKKKSIKYNAEFFGSCGSISTIISVQLD